MMTLCRLVAFLTGASVAAHATTAVAMPAVAVARTGSEVAAGANFASYLSSFNSLGAHYNAVLARSTDCEIPALAGTLLECRTSPMRAWLQIDHQHRRTDGDFMAASNDGSRWTGLAGLDTNVGPMAIVGVSVGKVGNRVATHGSSDAIDANGYQLGAYGLVDPGPFFAKAMATYSWFDGDSERDSELIGASGMVPTRVTGDPDVRLWTLGLHGGYRIAIGASSVLTPYLNLDYGNVTVEGFTEAGLSGAVWIVGGGREARATVTGGIKLAGETVGAVPEAKLGYRLQLGDRRSSLTARLLDNEEAASFDITSERDPRGALLAGVSLGTRLGPVAIRAGYEGLYSGRATSHGGNLMLVLPLGGREVLPPELQYLDPPLPPPPISPQGAE